AVPGAVQRGTDRAAAVAEGERGAALNELPCHLHAPPPAGVSERDLLAVGVAVDTRPRVEQPPQRVEMAALDRRHHTAVKDRLPALRAGRLVRSGGSCRQPARDLIRLAGYARARQVVASERRIG